MNEMIKKAKALARHKLRRATIYLIAIIITIPMYFLFWFVGCKRVALAEVWDLFTTDRQKK